MQTTNKLDDADFKAVYDYEGGTTDWFDRKRTA